MPVEVARYLRQQGHDAWTAYEAHLEQVSDHELVVYAEKQEAIAVTSNRDFVPVARRLRLCRVVYLVGRENLAAETIARALEWMDGNVLPDGMVLRVPHEAEIRVMPPMPW